MHEMIEELDLHGNKITDISVGDILSSCTNLKSLTLSYNPLSRAPKYRLIIAAMIPQLEILDLLPVDQNAKTKVSNGMILEAASVMQLEQEELDDERRMEMAILGDEFNTAMGYNLQYDTIKTENNNYNNNLNYSNNSNNTKTQGVIPDTGSDLTHGSNVVLAGNMAIAMRRRRQHSPLNDNENKKNRDGNEYSALEVLDNALIDGGLTKSKVPYYGEGDITSLFMSSNEIIEPSRNTRTSNTIPPSPHRSESPRNIEKKKKTRNISSTSVSFEADNNSFDRYDNDNKNKINKSNSNSSSRSHSNDNDDDQDDEDESIPIFSPSIRKNKVYEENEKPSRPTSRGNSSGNNRMNSPLNLQRRTPSPNSIKSRNGLPPSSPPVQRNASRPSSSRGGLLSGIASITPSAPFKVALPANGVLGANNSISHEEDFVNRLGTSRLLSREGLQTSNTRSDLESNATIPTLTNINKSIGIWDVSDDSSDDDNEDDDDNNNNNKMNNNISNKFDSKEKKNQENVKKSLNSKKYSSLANRDRVLRGNLFNEKNKDEDDEELAIDHLSRRKMCDENVITQKTAASTNAMKLFTNKFTSHNNNNNNNEDDDEKIKKFNNSNVTGTNRVESPEPLHKNKPNTLSHVAGRSLGFDLQGSLAAINQWVEDMDSDDDDEDDDDDENEDNNNNFNNKKNNKNKGNKNKPLSHKIGFLSNSNPTQKILSRDSILNMCIRGDEIGVNSNNSLSKDEDDLDEVANASEAYEENDVLFFDNNIEQVQLESLIQKKSKQERENRVEQEKLNQKERERERERQKDLEKKMKLQQEREKLKQKEKEKEEQNEEEELQRQQIKKVELERKQKQSKQRKQEDLKEDIQLKEEKQYQKQHKGKDEDEGGILKEKKIKINSQELKQSSKENIESPSKKSKTKSKPKSMNVDEIIELPEQNIDQNVNELNENSPTTNSSQVENAVELSDDALVVMLSQAPKSIPQMRTKSSFQDFFRGMNEERMRRLLHRAYGNLNDLEREVKVRKRMELLSDVLSHV
eukprot:CAMPEP_0174825864 /NCGR_PEP_ID=MMETSP1107-20130205/43194_1 /TAXON_ID=36770 /ORGANISM="Paraphysomonas vestita, Strain GFlagA" /LENGTH=1028 /DNA_ID=CAMNT_0016057917 /DNA_START=530 /DNA_END=3616 /DNA_ORIENTATION=-